MLGVEALICTPRKEAGKGRSILTHSVAPGHQASIPASLRLSSLSQRPGSSPLGSPGWTWMMSTLEQS